MRKKRILVGCEESGVVRRALRALGHDAWSCDLLPARDGDRHHIQCDVELVLKDRWDAGVFFPPCTYLCNSGVRWLYERDGRWWDMIQAAAFFRRLLTARFIPRVAVENPIMHKYARAIVGQSHDQVVQPWQFGHGETKATCLWLRDFQPLKHTNIVDGREARIHKMRPSENRSQMRSVTYEGIALAMADQWFGSSGQEAA